MANTTYGIIEEIYEIENEIRISYGIAAYADCETHGTTIIVDSIHDITNNKKKLKVFIQLCNRLELSLIHLREVVYDFLAD